MTGGVCLVIFGLLLLTFGGDRLVLSAARLSRRWGLSPLLIGALVVGMGTSAPELLVSVLAAVQGGLDLAVGNVVGSNVANLSLVLGASVLLSPIFGATHVLRREGGLMFVATIVMTILCWDGTLSRWDGLILVLGMVVAVVLMLSWARDKDRSSPVTPDHLEDESTDKPFKPLIEGALTLLSLFAVVSGAELLVRGAQSVAQALGFSQAFIGLTLVAIGTSLPELATALAAAVRRENDLLIGNVVGSNLFNSLAVLGSAGLAGAGSFSSDFRLVMMAMVAVCILAGIFVKTGDRVIRLEGVALLMAYAAFLYLST